MQGTEPSASRVGVRDFDWSLNAIKRAFPLVAWLRSVPGGTRLAQFPRPSECQPNHAFVHGPTALLPTSRPPQPVVVPPYPAPGGNGHYHRERIHSPNQSSGWVITRPPCLGRFLIGYQRPNDRSLECRHSVQPYLSRREIIMALVSSGVTTRPVDSYADAFDCASSRSGSMLHRVARGNGAQPASGRLHRNPSSRTSTRKKPVDVRDRPG